MVIFYFFFSVISGTSMKYSYENLEVQEKRWIPDSTHILYCWYTCVYLHSELLHPHSLYFKIVFFYSIFRTRWILNKVWFYFSSNFTSCPLFSFINYFLPLFCLLPEFHSVDFKSFLFGGLVGPLNFFNILHFHFCSFKILSFWNSLVDFMTYFFFHFLKCLIRCN